METIFVYSAKEAVEDGILHEVGDIAKEAGFKLPVRITGGVLNLVKPGKQAKELGQSYEGRLWDVLWMATLGIKKSNDEPVVSFIVIFQDEPDERHEVTLWAALDMTSGPAIHILLPEEY